MISLKQEPAVRFHRALCTYPILAGEETSSLFLKANSLYPEKLGHSALLLFLFLTHMRSDCLNIHAVPSNKCLLATCADIFKTVTLKNTHQHPNIWIYAWGLNTFCTYSYSHAWWNLILHICCRGDHLPAPSHRLLHSGWRSLSGYHWWPQSKFTLSSQF